MAVCMALISNARASAKLTTSIVLESFSEALFEPEAPAGEYLADSDCEGDGDDPWVEMERA